MTFYNFNYLLKSKVQIQSHLGLVFEHMNLVEHHSAHSRAHTDFCYHQTISKKILSGSQRNSWKTYVVYHNNNFRRSYILFFYHKSTRLTLLFLDKIDLSVQNELALNGLLCKAWFIRGKME